MNVHWIIDMQQNRFSLLLIKREILILCRWIRQQNVVDSVGMPLANGCFLQYLYRFHLSIIAHWNMDGSRVSIYSSMFAVARCNAIYIYIFSDHILFFFLYLFGRICGARCWSRRAYWTGICAQFYIENWQQHEFLSVLFGSIQQIFVRACLSMR